MRVANELLECGADPLAANSAGHQAQHGIEGTSRLELVALACEDASPAELHEALGLLEALLPRLASLRPPVDKARLAKVRLRQHRDCAGWDAGVDARFKELLLAISERT